jgi:hypothetical protein
MQKNKLYWPTYKKAERNDPRHKDTATPEQDKMHSTCKTHLASESWIVSHMQRVAIVSWKGIDYITHPSWKGSEKGISQ